MTGYSTDGLMAMAIAGLTDQDIAAYRAAITRNLPDTEPDTIRQLGRVVELLDAEAAIRDREHGCASCGHPAALECDCTCCPEGTDHG
jgi:hypothetical protein